MIRIPAWLRRLGERVPAPVQHLMALAQPGPPMPGVSTDAFGRIHVEQLDVLPEPHFVQVRARDRLRDNSTREHYWSHPPGHPYQVYGGPHGGDEMPTRKPWNDWIAVWTDSPVLEAYELIMDRDSDRLYHVHGEKQ